MTPEQNQMVLDNIRLVHMICNRYRRWIRQYNMEYDDLAQSGTIGLIDAVEWFDPSYGTKFSTFAVPRIIGKVRDAFRDSRPNVKYSKSVQALYREIYRAKLDDEDAKTIAKKLDRPLADVVSALNYAKPVFSLDRITGEDKDGRPISLSNFVEIDEDYSTAVVEDFIDSLPGKLPYIMRDILAEKTQKEIGMNIGKSQTQTNRYVKEIAKRLEEYMEVV